MNKRKETEHRRQERQRGVIEAVKDFLSGKKQRPKQDRGSQRQAEQNQPLQKEFLG